MLYRALTNGLTDAQGGAIDTLLNQKPEAATSWMGWLRQLPQSPAARNILALIERLRFVRELGIDADRQRSVSVAAFERLATDCLRTTVKSQTPHCNAFDIYSFFGVASSTGQGKSKQIRQWLKIHPFSFQWGLPSKFDSNPLIWTLTVDGMMVDVRHLPIEAQEVAYQKGLIPYVPGAKHS
jgi:hypothetical protein